MNYVIFHCILCKAHFWFFQISAPFPRRVVCILKSRPKKLLSLSNTFIPSLKCTSWTFLEKVICFYMSCATHLTDIITSVMHSYYTAFTILFLGLYLWIYVWEISQFDSFWSFDFYCSLWCHQQLISNLKEESSQTKWIIQSYIYAILFVKLSTDMQSWGDWPTFGRRFKRFTQFRSYWNQLYETLLQC